MSLYKIFFLGFAQGVVGAYLYDKYYKGKFPLKEARKVHYKFDMLQQYNVTGKRRQYEYNVSQPTFEKMEEQYRESLYGNPTMKNEIDCVLQDYLKTYPPITQKHIILNRPEWGANIENAAGFTDDFLVINIMTDDSACFKTIELK